MKKKRCKKITRDIGFLVIALLILSLSLFVASQINLYGDSVWECLIGLATLVVAGASIIFISVYMAEMADSYAKKKDDKEDKEEKNN